ncbi:hypothetical protein CR513_55342, partial [Mucuna pruriens]
MTWQCYVDNLIVPTKPSKEGNISTHVEISTDVELDPRPPVNQGAELIEKLEYIPLIDEEHHTQIRERIHPSDMLGIDLNVICHHLTLFVEAKLVAQRKRKTGDDKEKAIEQEMVKLKAAKSI